MPPECTAVPTWHFPTYIDVSEAKAAAVVAHLVASDAANLFGSAFAVTTGLGEGKRRVYLSDHSKARLKAAGLITGNGSKQGGN